MSLVSYLPAMFHTVWMCHMSLDCDVSGSMVVSRVSDCDVSGSMVASRVLRCTCDITTSYNTKKVSTYNIMC